MRGLLGKATVQGGVSTAEYAQLMVQPEREREGQRGRQMGTAAQFLGSCNQ
jgi:hypothetical protein